MRVTRAKQYRKHLRFFRIVYGISAPYKVVLDGNFIHGCISTNVDINARLASVLQVLASYEDDATKVVAEPVASAKSLSGVRLLTQEKPEIIEGAKIHLYVPRAAREELKALGPKFEKAYKFAMGHCRALPRSSAPPRNSAKGSGDGGVDPTQEILAAIGTDNADKYLVATQDESLRVRLRQVPGCPLLFVSRTVLIMEQPSGKSKSEFEKAERKGIAGTTEEEERVLENLKRKRREEIEKERSLQPRKRIKKKASAPNPLSCKRPKATRAGESSSCGGDAKTPSEGIGKGHARRRRKKSGGLQPRQAVLAGDNAAAS